MHETLLSSAADRRRGLLAGLALAVLAVAAPAGASTLIAGGTLVISETTYSDTGAVANLASGSSLPGPSVATANGQLSQVFNNSTPDGSFGVTSPITLQDINVTTNPGKVLNTVNIDPTVVSTSFSSKSELSLNITNTANGPVVTLVGYAAGGVGNLDVSNSDTTAYKDTTNPVTAFFAPNANQTYAYNRTVVQVSKTGGVSTTQTLAYGGNNGRAAVLGSNGLYYVVGNSNNGTGTPMPLTTSTGLEVVTPGATANSTMIDPGYKSIANDKAGKDNNFRGLTLYNGNLYFTKGSGSNGYDTVYTVSNPNGALPTASTAGQAVISVLPGFSTSPAKTAADFTPFGLFFANPTTLYVADEGTGDATDVSNHAGLEKWSLVNGTWKLDYTLRNNLIGMINTISGTNGGVDGSVTDVTSGLRDLAGRVNADGTVTLWAVTADTGGYTDTGADPNEIVQITDELSDTSLPTTESFSVLDAGQYGVRYGGVAYAVPEPSTWALLLAGFAGLGGVVRSRRRASALALQG